MNSPGTAMAAAGLCAVLGCLLVGGLPAEEKALPSALEAVASFSLALNASSASPRVPILDKTAVSPARNPSSLPASPRPDKPRPCLAAAEVVGINLGIWAILHYVTDAHYAYLSWETMRDNFRDSFEWDQSRYFVNFYHHPYHGYLYFNAGRANGLGYWGSALATLGGSLMWEMVLETYRPSINDLVTTTNGGCVYGEIGYRFSAMVRKSDARGLERIWRETVGAVLDPIGGLNRLFNGRRDDASGASGRTSEGAFLGGDVTLAWPVLWRSGSFSQDETVPVVAFTLNYGDPAGTNWGGKPFDIFVVQGRLRCGPDRPHLSLSVGGALLGKPLPGRGGSSHFLGIQQYYEYYGFDTLRVGGSSFTGGLSSRFTLSPEARLTTATRFGWLVLGGTEDFTDVVGERRIYNFGTGWTAAAEAALRLGGFEFLSAGWRHYALFNLRGQAGRETWDIFETQVRFPIWKKLGMGFQCEYCGRRTAFKDLPPGARRLFEARTFITCQF